MMLYLMNCQILCKAIHIIWRFVDVLLTHMHIQTITGKTCNVVPNPHMYLHENFWVLKDCLELLPRGTCHTMSQAAETLCKQMNK